MKLKATLIFAFVQIFLLNFAPCGEAYKMLAIFPFNSRSHYGMFRGLMRELARKGHEIDMIGHFPAKDDPPNMKLIINLEGTMPKIVNSVSLTDTLDFKYDLLNSITDRFGRMICDLMGDSPLKEFIQTVKNNSSYDVVITESFAANCYMGFAHLLKVPLVIMSTTMSTPWMDESIGSFDNSAFYPHLYNAKFDETNFWNRLDNAIEAVRVKYLFNYYTEVQTEQMRKYLSPDMPDIRTIERSAALALVNSHPVFHGSRSTVPSFVEVGGLHVEESSVQKAKLPENLQTWFDSNPQGVVYFTFGSMVMIETLPERLILDLYKSFAKIAPVAVLMKIANPAKLPAGLPSNVLTSSWIPQVPVLRHNNTKVFLTHGGLMSTQEALHHGVPIIGVPLFADQTNNIMTFVRQGMGILLPYEQLSEKTLTDALAKVINDPSYREAAKRESRKFLDRPMSAMETAIYWTEYVIRNGEDSLRSPSRNLAWWQLHLLDVYAFLLVCVITVLTVSILLVKFIISLVLSSKKPSHSSKKSN